MMKDIIIKEALPEDAEARIAYSKQIGSETDNLSLERKEYENFGFKKVGTLPAYFKIGEEYIDFDSMVLDLR